jgi:plasmid stabilization system protein ParE
MNYRVSFTAKSRGEFYEAALWWAEHRDVDQAARWIDGFQAAINGLGENPQRHAVIRETDLYDWKYMARPIKNVPLGLTRNGLEMINLSHERRNASYHGFSSARG